MYLALGIVFLIASLAMAAVVVFTTLRATRSGRELISQKNALYIVPAFLILYLLYVIAACYKGEKLTFFYLFSLVNVVFETFKFKPQNSIIMPLCDAMPIFYADFIIAYILGVLTVILGFVSIFSRKINNYISTRTLLVKDCDVVVGDSKDALQYIKNNKNCVLLGTNITTKRYNDLLKQGVITLRAQLDAKSLSRKLKKSKCNIIVFRDSNYSYTEIISTFTDLTDYGIASKIYLEANQQEMKILKEKFISKTDKKAGINITGFNRYELMARRFVADYPITKYIPRTFYNDNFTLKKDKQVNVVFVGFGKVNYQLFRMCAMQFQFVKEAEGKLVSSPVQYHIYDNVNTMLNNEFFSRILYEFDEVFSHCDFPKPEKICDVHTQTIDINSIEAKKQFKSLVNKDTFTYFVVSLDNDLEDASYAQTIKRLFNEKDNYHIFVRAKNNNGEKLNETGDLITYFGEEKKLYTHENIVNDDLTELAQRINLLYNTIENPPKWLEDLKKDKTSTPEQKNNKMNEYLAHSECREFMLAKWAELPYIEKASNLYHALNLPFKLNLLGFEMIKKRDKNDCGIGRAEFDKYYVNSGKATDYNDYSFFFKRESSNVLAYLEHSRWNALYFLYDYNQMKKDDIKLSEEQNENGKKIIKLHHKNPELKQHACLTSYYGIDELIRHKYKILYPERELNEKYYVNNKELEELSNVYRYDYMDLDRLYDEVATMGYKLISNKKEQQ